MISILRTIAWRLAACMLWTYLLYRASRSVLEPDWVAVAGSLVMSAYFYAAALATPLMDLLAEIRHGMSARALREVEGRFFAFHGHSIHVLEDIDHMRWIRTRDVRKVVGEPSSASDEALRLSYPGGFDRAGQPPEAFLSEEALLTHLAKSRDPVALRFRHWVEREVVFPGRRLRAQRGTERPRSDSGSRKPLGTEAFRASAWPTKEAPKPTASASASAQGATPEPSDPGKPQAS